MTESTGLSADRVSSIFTSCMFRDGEDTSKYVPAPGITTNVGFHPGRIEENRVEIAALLDELPGPFKESSGGGMSFLNACYDRNGLQWTGMHRTMEQLFQLGLATGKVGYVLEDRELWSTLPGGMPYFVVYNDSKEVELKAA